MSLRAVAAFLCALLALAAMARPSFAAENQRPNIVFFFADDHAYQALGAYGGYLKDVVRTPNLDRLASQGMLFRRCFVTNSICGPMRAVIQTGKYSPAEPHEFERGRTLIISHATEKFGSVTGYAVHGFVRA